MTWSFSFLLFFFYRCVVETDPDGTWYMSRSFQQTSLSAAGLFITDSGIMAAVKFRHAEKLFFRCVINFCFFTATDLCDNVSFHSYMFLSNCFIF